jgi:hypothetical protein
VPARAPPDQSRDLGSCSLGQLSPLKPKNAESYEVHRASSIRHILGFATAAGLLEHLGTLLQVVAVALERGAGPPERHTDCIGVGWLMQHTPPRATQLTHTLQFMHVSDNA